MANRQRDPVQNLFLFLRLVMVIFLLLLTGIHLLPLSKQVAIALLSRLWEALKFLAMTTAVSVVIFATTTTTTSSPEYDHREAGLGLGFERGNSSKYNSDYSSDGEVQNIKRQKSSVRKSYSFDDLKYADDYGSVNPSGSADKDRNSKIYGNDKKDKLSGNSVIKDKGSEEYNSVTVQGQLKRRSGKESDSDFYNDLQRERAAMCHRPPDHVSDTSRHLLGKPNLGPIDGNKQKHGSSQSGRSTSAAGDEEFPGRLYLADIDSDSKKSAMISGELVTTPRRIAKHQRARSRSRSRSVERRYLIPSSMGSINTDTASVSGSHSNSATWRYREPSKLADTSDNIPGHSKSDTPQNVDKSKVDTSAHLLGQSKADTSRDSESGKARLSLSRSGKHIHSMSAVDLTELVAIAEKTNYYNINQRRPPPPKIRIKPGHQKSNSYDFDRPRPPPPPPVLTPAMGASSEILSSRYGNPEEHVYRRKSSGRFRRSPLSNNNNSTTAVSYHSDSDDVSSVVSPSAEMINERATKFIDDFYQNLLRQRQNSLRERRQQQQQEQQRQ